ncbi:MAG: hypothetical protein ACOX3A_01090 [bacterium]
MQLGIELMAKKDLILQNQAFFEVFISINGQPIAETLGRDNYFAPFSIIKGKRISATGRKCIHRNNSNKTFTSGPAELVFVPEIIAIERALFFMKSSVAYKKEELFHRFYLCILTGDKKQTFELTNENVFYDWSNHGKFFVNLTNILT